jgi:hypothetical protein
MRQLGGIVLVFGHPLPDRIGLAVLANTLRCCVINTCIANAGNGRLVDAYIRRDSSV